jgi:hypothetical protein
MATIHNTNQNPYEIQVQDLRTAAIDNYAIQSLDNLRLNQFPTTSGEGLSLDEFRTNPADIHRKLYPYKKAI